MGRGAERIAAYRLSAVRGADPPAAPLLAKRPAGSPGFPSAPSQSQLSEFCPPGSSGLVPGVPGFPLPRLRAASLPSPRPAHGPSPPVPGPSPPPLSLPPPPAPPTACSPVPVTLLGVYAWSPPQTPLGAPEPPGAPARQPRSLAAADGVAARAGAAEPGAQLARGRRAPPPTQPGPVPGPRWPVAPSGPEGEEVGGRGG